MNIDIDDLSRHMGGSPGDHLSVDIQQLGEDKNGSDKTSIIVDTSREHKDIRIVDGSTVIKIRLDNSYEIRDVLKDDVIIS